eukprot:2743311-Pyramimonas_sp.AAC.1
MFAEIGEKKDDYKKLYEQFGKRFKLGAHEDVTDRTKVAELMHYHTSNYGDEMISLDGARPDATGPVQASVHRRTARCGCRMAGTRARGQNDLYCITG